MRAGEGVIFMNMPKGWKTGLVITTLLLILGMTALTYGLARLDQLPTGQEVVAHGIELNNNQQATVEVTATEGKTVLQEQSNDQEQLKAQEKAQSTERKNNLGQAHELSIKDFSSPVKGEPLRKVGNYYSENLTAYLFHAGNDYALSEGAVIRATHGGKVIFAGPDPILGQKVEIDCGENWRIVYGGLENLRIQQGEFVEVNDALGQVGYFAGADGVNDRHQLHYEVWHGDEVQIQ